MKLIQTTLSAFLFCFTFLFGAPRLPEEFTVVERFLSLTATFDVSSDLGPFAVARKRLFSLTPAFDLEDGQSNALATAKTRFFAWGTVADAADPGGEPIGTIEEAIWRIVPWAEYKIYNGQGTLAAIARMNFWGTHFDLYPPDSPGHLLARIERPFIRCFRDHWTVQVHDARAFEEGVIDPRLLILLAVLQTDKDNRDRLRKEFLDRVEREREEFEGNKTFD
jgi:hypothetical protein